LTTELVGSHPSVTAVAAQIAERAAGNPFFVQEIVRDLAERGVLDGNRGAYVCHRDIGDVGVPATVQAAIAARIDRLDAAAKRTLNAASVIGLRCSEDLLTCVLGEADAGGAHGAALSGLVGAELLDQVMFTPARSGDGSRSAPNLGAGDSFAQAVVSNVLVLPMSSHPGHRRPSRYACGRRSTSPQSSASTHPASRLTWSCTASRYGASRRSKLMRIGSPPRS
jgi:hypothetical protein